MKKTLLALSAAAIALSGMAATPKEKLPVSKTRPDRSAMLKTSDVSRIAVPAAPSMKKAPAKVGSPEDVITSAEGQLQNYTGIGTGYALSMFGIAFYENDTFASHVVYGEGDEVYIYDPIPYFSAGSYVKGVKKGDKIEVSLPQTVEFNKGAEYGYYLCMLEFKGELNEDGELEGFFYPNEAESVTISVKEDGSMSVDGINEDVILGLAYTDEESWAGYGVVDLSFVEFNETAVTPPDDIEVSKNFWVCGGGDYGWPVSWAQGYDEFYFQGLCPEMPDAWVKGTVEYDEDFATISIEQGQYMGVYMNYYIKTKCAAVVYDEEWDAYFYEDLPEDYKYELIWDYEDNIIVAKDPEVALLFNASEDDYSVLNEMYGVQLVHQDSYEGTPQNPVILGFYDALADGGDYSEFNIAVPAVSTDGDFLLTENLYYIVYVDGEEWEFDADEYQLDENIVEVPWNLDVYYIYNWGGIEREVDFFVEGITTLGVQSVYKYDGEETRSEIVTLNLEDDPDAVGTVNAGKKITDVKYYGLDGRQVVNPAAGIFVKRVTFEDGTVATYKKAVR
ncbi:MAG: hypothetical protein K2L11_04190 [Muribaculaceae bacterium]|nr:hypothetical protein [Muribaculaceae bacterium]